MITIKHLFYTLHINSKTIDSSSSLLDNCSCDFFEPIVGVVLEVLVNFCYQ